MNAAEFGRVALALGVVLSGVAVGSAGLAAGTGAPDASDARSPATDALGGHPVGPATPATATDPPDEADAVLRDGVAYFLGQALYTEAFGVGDNVDLERPNGSFVTDVPLRGDGSVLLETRRLAPGNYVLTDNADRSIEFELVRQQYDLTVSDRSVRNGGNRTTTQLSFESNRVGYTHVVGSPNLSARELRGLLGTGTVRDVDGDGTDELTIPSGSTEQSFTADFDGLPAGNYTLSFSVADALANASTTVEVGVYPPGDVTIAESEDGLRIQQTAGRLIAGTTTLPPDTKLRITVTNDGGQAFRRSSEVRVRGDGSFGARFDFSGIPQGQSFTVSVSQGAAVRARASGVVVAPAALSVDDHRSPEGRTVAVGTAVLPDGGFVAVRTAEGGFLGASDYLPPGTHRDLTIGLDEPLAPGTTVVAVSIHRDTDRDRTFGFADDPAVDVPYERAGIAVQKSVRVTVPATPTTTTTRTPTGTPGPTPTETTPTAGPTPTETTAAATGTTTAADEGGSGGAPGFGASPAALAVALLAALAARRSER